MTANDNEAVPAPDTPPVGQALSFGLQEWSGAFGDLGTLVPFVLAYIAVADLAPGGILLGFGVPMILVGLIYRTPFPVQPMKAIGSAVAGQAMVFTPAAVYAAGLVTGLAWLLIGGTGLVQKIARIVGRPVTMGIILGLGALLMLNAVEMMAGNWWIAAPVLLGALLLLANKRIPVMLLLLVVGALIALVNDPQLAARLGGVEAGFALPEFTLGSIGVMDLFIGTLVLALPQLPLTFGNAVMAITEENNRLFPTRPTSERRVAVSTGLMNVFGASIGGVPMCHGAGGMAGHVRFGARTGGAPLILGTILVIIALFFSGAVELFLQLFPMAVLGVVLFLAGAQLALGVCEGWERKADRLVLVTTAAVALWNVGVAFIFGLVLYALVNRGLVKP